MVQSSRVPVWPLFIGWGMIAAALVARAVLTAATTPLILDTDDAMRLTIVHDLLAGQGWFDHMQHRLNTPFGGDMHWSRLIDLPEAAILAVLRPLAGPLADTLLAFIWPLLLLGGLLALGAHIAMRLGGRPALWPALLLPAMSLITLGEFTPGRLDHHSTQILLALATLAGLLAAPTHRRSAPLAGVAAGIALAIGIEALPVVAAAIVGIGLLWVADSRQGTALRDFGLALAVTTTLGLALGVAPANWFVPAADAISITFVLAAMLCGAAFLVLSLLPLRAWPLRLVAGIVAGLAVAALTVWSYPPVLRGPYGMLDPWLQANWIDRISEAKPFVLSFLEEPIYAIAVGVPVLTAILVACWNIVRNNERRSWLLYLCVLMVTVAVMAIQIRAARFAVPLALPADAVLVGAAWHRMVNSKGFGPIFAMLGSVVVSAGIFVAVIAVMVRALIPGAGETMADPAMAARNACIQPAAFTALAQWPPQRLMTPIDLGSHALLFTPHAVVSAPYHRNQQSLLDTYRFFNGPIADARAILAARGIDLVVVCPAMHEVRGYLERAPDSFVSLFAAGTLPTWLREVTPAGTPLRIFAVAPQPAP